MATLKEMKLTLLHDRLRRDVTNSLQWAMDFIEEHKERLPCSTENAFAWLKAKRSLDMSKALTHAGEKVMTEDTGKDAGTESSPDEEGLAKAVIESVRDFVEAAAENVKMRRSLVKYMSYEDKAAMQKLIEWLDPEDVPELSNPPR